MSQSVRSKQGSLQLYKGKKWKNYLFRVTGSTYLHYFGDKKMTEPKHQIFLSSVRNVEVLPHYPKGGDFVFEVKHSGKHSPWILNAPTHDDRIQWMEAILPGSSKNICNPMKKTDSASFTTSTPSPPPPPRYSPPITQPHNKITVSPLAPLAPLAAPNPYVTLVPHPQQSIQYLPYPEQPVCMPRHQFTQSMAPQVSQRQQFTESMGPQVSQRQQFTQFMAPQVSQRQQFTQSMAPQVSQRQQFTDSMGPQVSPRQQFTDSMGPQVSLRQQFTDSMGPQVSPRRLFTESVCPEVSPQQQFTDSIDPQVCLVNQHSILPCPQHSTMPNPQMPHPQNDLLSPTDDLLSPGPIPSPRDRKESDARHYIQPSSLNMPNKKVSRAHSNSIQKHRPRQVKTKSQEESIDSQEVQTGNEEYVEMSSPVPTMENPQGPAYMVLQDPVVNPSGTGSGSSQPGPQSPGVMDLLSKQFTEDQLTLLLGMLQQLRVKGNENNGSNSTKDASPKDLEYLVTRTAGNLSNSILVTDEDDPASYDKRPSWAKAVYEELPGHNMSFAMETHDYEIPRTNLINMIRIGSGQFGEVFKAEYISDEQNPNNSTAVAVKTTKPDCTDKEKKELLREMAVMSCMIHPNIVRLYGVVTEDVPAPWIVLEYLPYGDLKTYLSNSPKKSSEVLVKYMVDVAMGMHYIAERGLIHRDLAARNVLVGAGELCKVADFGLLRELPDDDSIYISTANVPCPIRWMAPESIIKRKFSIASDVWSFGILQWEMYNPSRTPYDKMDNFQVAMKVNEGYRLPTPRGSPSTVARVMKACWHAEPTKRPSFLLIATLLTTKVSSAIYSNSLSDKTYM